MGARMKALRLGAILSLALTCLAHAELPGPDVALDYADHPPLALLRSFDVAVVDPDASGVDPKTEDEPGHQLFAYVSLGELASTRHYDAAFPTAWLRERNPAWDSRRIDQTAPGWPDYVLDHIMAPLWQRGFRGFFLDTLDAYNSAALSAAQRTAQIQALASIIARIHGRWPQARLIFNRGFELLPQVHDAAWMVAAESLNWTYADGRYQPVDAATHASLFATLQRIHQDDHLPILAIDYLPASDAAGRAADVRNLLALGFIPYVSDPTLEHVGRGRIEPLRRDVLVVTDAASAHAVNIWEAQRSLGMPLAYLGLVAHYVRVDELLAQPDLDRGSAGVIVWLNGDHDYGQPWNDWITRRLQQGRRLVFFNQLGLSDDMPALRALGLKLLPTAPEATWRAIAHNAHVGFELPLAAQYMDVAPLQGRTSDQSWLRLADDHGDDIDPVAITAWGAYALAPFVIRALNGGDDDAGRWLIDPIAFLHAGLALPDDAPVADVSTASGRRVLMVHIDGDGFVNRVERAGFPFSADVLYHEVLLRHPWPTTFSVIEGEIAADGLHPDLAPQAEAIARQIFALPWVEIASHTYSHPFDWRNAAATTAEGSDAQSHLPIPGYQFSLHREIEGSIDYINRRLAPAGKKVQVLLWSGNCVPSRAALAETAAAGIRNMNGGDTTMTDAHRSWTLLAGLGVFHGPYYQVFAPNQNENVYTHDWTGPFYGFRNVIQTYELTETPYRLKPIDLYYHIYAVSKPASLNALQQVYAWLATQNLHPVFASQYIDSVLDFNDFAIARTPQGFRLRGHGALRDVRLPASGAAIDLQHSSGIAGWAPGPQARYLTLSGASAELVLGATPDLPYVIDSNGRLSSFDRHGARLDFGLHADVALSFSLHQRASCQLWQGQRRLIGKRLNTDTYLYQLSQHDAPSLRLQCP